MPLFSNDLILGFDPLGQPVILSKERRCLHTVLIGRSGSGKSKAIQSLIQQDLLAWPETRCGLALFDPHGTVVDNLLAFCVSHGLNTIPITPFDCRRLDFLVAFNPLRARRGVEPATIISGCIESLLHAWGEWDSNQTPRLEKWLRTILLTVFLSGGTLGDSLAILRSPDLRRAMTRHLEDEVARTVWASAASLKESEFVTSTESLLNRIQRFISTTMLRLSLNQEGPSLDFSAVLDKGGIVLISLATAGGAIDEVDARTLGALLLQDLWTAARIRGKGEAGQKRAFRVYLDEFQKYLTPSMAEGLAEARGFALEMLFACQSTTQMRATPAGQQVLDAVLANAHTKVVFNIQHPLDVDTLAPWLYRNQVNPDIIKYQHYSTKVLEHEIKYFQSTSHSRTQSTATSTNWSSTQSVSQSEGTNTTRGNARGRSSGVQRGRSEGQNKSTSSSVSDGTGISSAESSAEGTTHSTSSGRSQGRSRGLSEGKHLDGEYDDLKKVVGEEPTASFDKAYTDKDEEHRPLHRTINQTRSENDSESNSASQGSAMTRSKSKAQARQVTHAASQAASVGKSTGYSEAQSENASVTASDSFGTSKSTSRGISDTSGGSETVSEAVTEGATLSPMLLPKMGKEASAPVFATTDEQLFRYAQRLAALPDRHAVVRTGTTPPIEIITPTVEPAAISARGIRAFATLKLKRLAFAMPLEEATRRLAERQRQMEEKFLGTSSTDEPKSLVRRIRRDSHG